MTNSPMTLIFLMVSLTLSAQFSFDFSDEKSLNELGFFGDTEHFVILDGTLKLQAPEAGKSAVFIKTNIPDSIEYNIDFQLDFSPSANNKLRIYLQLDTVQLDLASGYFIEIGENGAEDKIRFVRLINGEALTIAEGNPGEFSSDPVDSQLKVMRDHKGLWQVSIKHFGASFFKNDIELFDSTIKRYFDQYFGLECIYTATRTDRFYFDEIHLREVVKDTLPPEFLQFEVLDDHTIAILFDEILDKSTALNPLNYTLSLNGTHPEEVKFNDFKPNRIVLEFDMSFDHISIYSLLIDRLKDLQGNPIVNKMIEFYYPAIPSGGRDIVINELLFDPIDDLVDFVELYNRSGLILDLQGLEIMNAFKTNSAITINEKLVMFPNGYLLLCEDSARIGPYYIPDTVHIAELKLPSFNNDNGNVKIVFSNVTIDSLDYDEAMHFPLIDDTEGISLERISPDADTNEPSNWHSASGVYGGATPGYQNSQFRMQELGQESFFSIPEPLFSPDNDGFMDRLLINYSFPEEGFTGTVHVFDLSGQFKKTIVNNKLLGTRGLVSWDGLDVDGSYLQLGPYIIVCSAFHPTGKVVGNKLVAFLVGER